MIWLLIVTSSLFSSILITVVDGVNDSHSSNIFLSITSSNNHDDMNVIISNYYGKKSKKGVLLPPTKSSKKGLQMISPIIKSSKKSLMPPSKSSKKSSASKKSSSSSSKSIMKGTTKDKDPSFFIIRVIDGNNELIYVKNNGKLSDNNNNNKKSHDNNVNVFNEQKIQNQQIIGISNDIPKDVIDVSSTLSDVDNDIAQHIKTATTTTSTTTNNDTNTTTSNNEASTIAGVTAQQQQPTNTQQSLSKSTSWPIVISAVLVTLAFTVIIVRKKKYFFPPNNNKTKYNNYKLYESNMIDNKDDNDDTLLGLDDLILQVDTSRTFDDDENIPSDEETNITDRYHDIDSLVEIEQQSISKPDNNVMFYNSSPTQLNHQQNKNYNTTTKSAIETSSLSPTSISSTQDILYDLAISPSNNNNAITTNTNTNTNSTNNIDRSCSIYNRNLKSNFNRPIFLTSNSDEDDESEMSLYKDYLPKNTIIL